MEKNVRLLSVFEEVEKYGTESVHTIELFSAITGAKLEVAKELFEEFGTLQRVCSNAISKRGGLTKTQAYKAKLVGELLKRNNQKNKNRFKAGSPSEIANIYMDYYKDLEVEHFDVLLLNTQNRVISKINISKGTLNATVVHPRDVFREAMKYNASSILLIHNHPSGNSNPSKEDAKITNRLVETGQLVGIPVLDHIVFGGNEYYSFREEGQIK